MDGRCERARDTGLRGDLGPLSDVSVLILMMDDAVSQQNNQRTAALAEAAPSGCARWLLGFHSVEISLMSDPCDL